jgi:hypothetical protein
MLTYMVEHLCSDFLNDSLAWHLHYWTRSPCFPTLFVVIALQQEQTNKQTHTNIY